jgi:hypothetical protein
LSQGSLKLLCILGVARKKKREKKETEKKSFGVSERNLGGEDEAKGDQAK